MMKKIITIFFLFVLFFSSAISVAQDRVEALGEIVYEKGSDSFYFLLSRDESLIPIYVKDKKNRSRLKRSVGRSVLLSGEMRTVPDNSNELSTYSSKLVVENLNQFTLSQLMISDNEIVEIDYSILDRKKKNATFLGVIPLKDKTANRLIAGSVAALCLVVGPLSLIPLSLFAIKSWFLD